ncbi:hypothetical protein BG006_000238 [Podila minutissima]|uniref:Uncharacterized protein n=1 Tax=Podila minutissima TaxID=64525 RepID=A0A9P5VPE9_9FUNG|nr:hypothetical protein BG006_000238 [Podila minutissima]
MFPRSERFVDKIEITPGPNHYDVKVGDEDPYKKFGFLGKTKRFNNEIKVEGAGGQPGALSSNGVYERNSLSLSLPSLIVDDGARSPDTMSVHSNGSITPDYTRRPSNPRSRSSEKLSSAFAANSSRTEERLRRELAELTDRFDKFRLSHQKDIDGLTEKQKKGEAMYQNCVKEKNSILTQLAAKESEIGKFRFALDARQSFLKATLEKSEKAAAQVTEKISKTNQLQKRIEELEKLNARSKSILEEQESITVDLRKKHELERQQLEQQFLLQNESSEQELARVNEQQRVADAKYQLEIQQARDESEDWRRKLEALERLVKELERQLAEERKRIADLEEQLRRERERLTAQLEEANNRIKEVEQEQSSSEAIAKEAIRSLEQTKEQLQAQLQKTEDDFRVLTEQHQNAVKTLEEQKVQHADQVKSMTISLQDQKTQVASERQENMKARQDLEASIGKLIAELAQNRDSLLKVQRERTDLEEQYQQSQQDLEETACALGEMREQHRQLQLDSKREQEAMVEKYNALSAESIQQKQDSDSAVAELNAALDKKGQEYDRVIKSIEAVQAELKQVELEKAEVIAQRLEEERIANETRQRLEQLEQEKKVSAEQMDSLNKDKEALEAKHEKLKEESNVQILSINSLLTEIDLVRAEKAEREERDNKRIQELEDIYQVATKQAETFHDNEKVWESERVKLVEEYTSQNELIESLQIKLEEITVSKEEETRVQVDRIKELEARCQVMEKSFKDLYDATGSKSTVEATPENEAWKQHSTILMDTLRHQSEHCSITKDEHEALLKEKEELAQSAATLTASLQEQGATFKRSHGDQSGLLAKIAELEDQICQLQMQVEFLEAENIGKVAIVKALQDEYEYQEKVIRELSKNEDAAKEVPRLEEELRALTNHTREMDEWIKQVQQDVEKYKAAYMKADVAREETLLDMANLHEQLAESEATRLQAENQLNAEVSVLIKKHDLSSEELARLSKMNVDSAQNQGLKQKVKQITQLKEENLALKKKNLALSNTRDSLRLKCLQVERDLESYRAATTGSSELSTAGSVVNSSRHRKRSTSISGSSIVSSSSALLGSSSTLNLNTPSDQVVGSRLQLQSEPTSTPRSTSPLSSTASSPTSKQAMAQPKSSTLLLAKSFGASKSATNNSKPSVMSRAARTFMAGSTKG